MKKYLYITAITLPFAAGSAWAQDTTTPPADPAPTEQMDSESPDSATGMSTDQAPAEDMTEDMEAEGEMDAEGDMDAEGTDMTGDAPATGEMASDAPADAVPSEGGAENADAVVSQQDSAEMLGDWLLSTGVISPEGETIGSIKDFIITEEGQITGVILGVGGFLGIGEKDIAVDYSQLDIQYDGDAIELAMTREQAEEAPEYQYREKETPPSAQPAGDAMGTGGTGSGMGTGTGTGTGSGMTGGAPATE
ncbi:PRC-barrel domain-containing protein [Salipiger marinus]|uniref:PRC-barrel domain-containing protein n=1 Tax=Salipiger marinus TaxID=555512 RepID=UPI002BD9942B|nr:PRC-barrel domain-containing protein [Salipiger manganoxidans]MEB3420435.1 PRC-barrel domain-containing protein [Salipiger manganoxidans]